MLVFPRSFTCSSRTRGTCTRDSSSTTAWAGHTTLLSTTTFTKPAYLAPVLGDFRPTSHPQELEKLLAVARFRMEPQG